MRKFLLALTLTVVAAFGVGISGGSSLAATNCTHSDPAAPSIYPAQLGGFQLSDYFVCTDVSQIQFNDHLYRGGYADDFVAGPLNYYPASPPSFAITLYNRVNGCGVYGSPYWWGHWITFRLRNLNTGTFGNWITTGSSAGTYGQCY